MADYKIGTTLIGITNLASLATPVDAPIVSDVEYDTQRLGNGQYEQIGYGVCTWTWPVMTAAQLAQLRTFCSGASAAVFLRTVPDRNAATTYANYSAVMVWPKIDKDKMMGGLAFDITIAFEHMEAAS